MTHLETVASITPVGTFAVLNQDGDGSGYNAAFVASGTAQGGMFTFASKAVYDSVHRRIFHCAAGHPAGSLFKSICYDVDSNTWNLLPQPSWASVFASANGHCYQLQTIAEGLYIRGRANSYSIFASTIDEPNKADLFNPSSTVEYADVIPTNPPNTSARAFIEYFPERQRVYFFDSGGSYRLYEKTLTGAWAQAAIVSGLNNDGIACAHNPVRHEMVFGGGVVNYVNGVAVYRTQWWKMNSTGVVSPIDNAPMYSYAHGSALFMADPLTGKYLSITATTGGYRVYELDTSKPMNLGLQWARRTDIEALMPQLSYSPNSLVAVVAVPLPEYMVAVLMTYNKAWIYKFGSTSPSLPAIPTDLGVLAS